MSSSAASTVRPLETLRQWVMSRPAQVGALLFIVSLAARLALTLTSRFTGDEISFWETARKVATGEEFPLLGPIITNGPARHPGPLLFDVIALPLLINKAPEAANIFVALLGALSVVIYWKALRIHFGEWGALLGGLMMACSPWSTLYADRIWNPNVLGILLSLSFYAACRLRKEPTLGMTVLLFASMAAMPQLHMSSPMVWLALVPIWLPSIRKWRWHWPLIAIAVSLVLYIPLLAHELQTNWSNTNAFLHDAGAVYGDGQDYKRVPLWAFRLLTLDVAYHQLHLYWGPRPEADLFKFLMEGNSDFHYGVVRYALLLLSVLLALGALGVSIRSAWWGEGRGKPRPFFWAAVIGLAANVALLGLMHKEVFGHYVQPLLPVYFVAFAELGRWAEQHGRRAIVWGATCLVAIGGIDAAVWVSQTMDARNGLLTMRRVMAAIDADQPGIARVGLSIRFPGGSRGNTQGYNALASLDPKHRVNYFDAGGPYLIRLREETPPRGAVELLETGPIKLYRMK